MTPTLYFRWYVYRGGCDWGHPSAIATDDGRDAQVLQQWWCKDGEAPPSSFGDWRDVPMEGPA